MGMNNENAMLTPSPWLVFDIETCPLPECSEYLTDAIEAPSNYKDPVKIAAFIDEKRLKQINDAGLDLDLCRIVAIAGAFHDTNWCQSGVRSSEEDMLRGFWRFAQNTLGAGGVLVGFNCLYFDLPILLRRSLYLGIPTPKLSLDRYRHDGIVDVADALSFGRIDFRRSLAFYAKRFGIPHDDTVDGSQIAQLVASGEWAQVERHCTDDVSTTTTLAQRIGLIQGAFEREAVAL